MERHRLVVHGNVQAVGYRAFVKMVARNMRIHGSVRNLDDGTVEIYCECPEETYAKFRSAIDRKAVDPSDPMQMNVTKIEEQELAGGEDKEQFRYPFDVLYDGMDIPPLEKEALERSEMAILAMTSMNMNLSGKMDKGFKELGEKMDKGFEELGGKVDAVGEKVERNIDETRKVGENVDIVAKKVESGFEGLGKKVDDMHIDLAEKLDKNREETELFRNETKEEFAALDSKYHVVSERLLSMDKSLKLTEEKLVESVERLTQVVEKFLKQK